MKIVFRADASPEMGTGHILRSSALAEEAISQEIECVFIGSFGGIDWVEDRIKSLGFSAILTNDKDYLSDSMNDILVLDSYSIDPDDSFIAKASWRHIISIADEITPRYDVDLLVHPGLYFDSLRNQTTQTLAGPDFILTRKAIRKVNDVLMIPSTGPTVLVVGGGSDPHGFCNEVAVILDQVPSALNAHFFSNELIVSSNGKNFLSHPIGPELDEFAEKANVVLTTASTSSLEFIGREIPTGVACVADNQRNNYDVLSSLKVAQKIGTYSVESGWELDRNAIISLIESYDLRMTLHKSSANLIDLQGAKRILDAIKTLM
jgi:spore coat polysaccharide biosynthesis predicted glycosyltransferase SpsG